MLERNISLKQGKGISWLLGRIKRGKEGKEKQYHLPFNIKALGKNIQWGKGESDRNFEEENQDLRNGDEQEYQVVGNFIHP